MSGGSKEKVFVSVMNANQQAFEALYFQDCFLVLVNPYSIIRNWIDGVINGLRPDSDPKITYRVGFLDKLDIDFARIFIELNLLDDRCEPFNITFMSDWKLDKREQTLSINNNCMFRGKILFQEKKIFNILDEYLFTGLTQMIKRLVRNSIKNLC